LIRQERLIQGRGHPSPQLGDARGLGIGSLGGGETTGKRNPQKTLESEVGERKGVNKIRMGGKIYPLGGTDP